MELPVIDADEGERSDTRTSAAKARHERHAEQPVGDWFAVRSLCGVFVIHMKGVKIAGHSSETDNIAFRHGARETRPTCAGLKIFQVQTFRHPKSFRGKQPKTAAPRSLSKSGAELVVHRGGGFERYRQNRRLSRERRQKRPLYSRFGRSALGKARQSRNFLSPFNSVLCGERHTDVFRLQGGATSHINRTLAALEIKTEVAKAWDRPYIL